MLVRHVLFALPALGALVAWNSPVAGALLFVSVFALVHDAMHRSLGLPRWANEAILAVGGAFMGVSGTAARTMHLLHHARPGAPDDFEGRGIRLSLGRALLASPLAYFELPALAMRRSRRRGRQLGEWALTATLFFAGLAAGGAPRTHALVALVAQLTIQVWASHVPHRAPAWMIGIARGLAWTHLPLVLAFAFHDLHHERPDLGCFELGDREARSALGRAEVAMR